MKRKLEKHKIEFYFCGHKHLKGRGSAYGKICSKCQGKNHFTRVCQNKIKNTHAITNEEVSDVSLGSLTISIGGINERNDKSWTENVKVGSETIKFKLDTGAEVSILPVSYLKKMNITQIKRSNCVLSAWGDENFKIKPLGHIVLPCEIKARTSV